MALAKRDHTAEAYARLSHQFKDKPNIQALLAIFAGRYDELETAYYALLVERTIYTAVGAQLDQIGARVGQPRNGLADEVYRRYILARIAANKSDGLVEDLIDVVRLVLNDTTLSTRVLTTGVATTVARVLGDRVEWGTAAIAMEMLRRATAGGDRPLLEFETWPTTTITKTGGVDATWDTGASSLETILGDGRVSATVTPANRYQLIGLSESDPDPSFASVKYGWYTRGDSLSTLIYELGSQKFNLGFQAAAGDILEVERVGNTIRYLRNGALVYTSLVTTVAPLLVDSALYRLNAPASGWSDVRLYDAGRRKQISWQNVKNVTIAPPMPVTAYSGRARFADSTVYDGAFFYPHNASEVQAALGAGIWTSGAGWLFDELSGNLAPAFGSPTLTATSLLYGITGFRGGTDRAIGFNASTANADGGDVFDVTGTDDLIIAWAGTVTAATGSTDYSIVNKYDGGTGWQLFHPNNASTYRFQGVVASAQIFATGDASAHIGEKHFGILVLDRSTGKARLATRSASGVSSVTAEVTLPVTSMANALAFHVGDLASLVGVAPRNTHLSALYVVAGSGVATGVSANLSNIITSFANYVTRVPSGYTTTPTYGQGLEDVADKYPRAAIALATLVGLPNQSSGAGYLCNEASGNLSSSYGTPATLTASGTVTYGTVGPRGGNDKAVGFAAGTDKFDGGDVYDVSSTEDLSLFAVIRLTSATANGILWRKGLSGDATRWAIYASGGGTVVLEFKTTSGTVATACAYPITEWFALGAVIDRSTGKMRIATKGLTTGTAAIDSERTPFVESVANTNGFTLGGGGGGYGNTPSTFHCAGFHINAGSGIASGASANLAAIVGRYMTQMNRFYGGPLSAAME